MSNVVDIEASFTIPGSVFVRLEGGVVKAIAFTPAASNAGYFGPAAVQFSGAPMDTESVDGPFWQAVQERLALDSSIEWVE